MDRKRICESNSVGDLHEATMSQFVSNNGLSDIAAIVGSRAINLGGVLAGESTTAMGSPATISIDNNLASGQTSIGVGTTLREFTGRVNNELSVYQEV